MAQSALMCLNVVNNVIGIMGYSVTIHYNGERLLHIIGECLYVQPSNFAKVLTHHFHIEVFCKKKQQRASSK